MSKVDIPDIKSQFASTNALNTRFQTIEDTLNDKVLFRDTPVGEPNTMLNDLDMGDQDIINVKMISADDFIVAGDDITTGIQQAVQEANQARDEAQSFATGAENSATASEASNLASAASAAASETSRLASEAAKDVSIAARDQAQVILDSVVTTGDTQVARVTAEGTNQVGIVQATGTTEVGKVTTEGTTQVNRVVAEGDTQEGRVTNEGNTQIARIDAAGLDGKAPIDSPTFTTWVSLPSKTQVRKTNADTAGGALHLETADNQPLKADGVNRVSIETSTGALVRFRSPDAPYKGVRLNYSDCNDSNTNKFAILDNKGMPVNSKQITISNNAPANPVEGMIWMKPE